MTGAYLRAKRGDKFENIEVEHLTEDEIKEKFLHRPPEELVNWMIMLCKHLRHLDPLLKSLERDGIIARGTKEEFDAEQKETE
jgi:hypothetical protein